MKKRSRPLLGFGGVRRFPTFWTRSLIETPLARSISFPTF